MRANLKVSTKYNPKDNLKFIEVVEKMNSTKKTNIQIIEENKNMFVVEYDTPEELFILGRIFEPYKPDSKGKSITIRQNNDFIYAIWV